MRMYERRDKLQSSVAIADLHAKFITDGRRPITRGLNVLAAFGMTVQVYNNCQTVFLELISLCLNEQCKCGAILHDAARTSKQTNSSERRRMYRCMELTAKKW